MVVRRLLRRRKKPQKDAVGWSVILNEAKRNEESILLQNKEFWILHFVQNDKRQKASRMKILIVLIAVAIIIRHFSADRQLQKILQIQARQWLRRPFRLISDELSRFAQEPKVVCMLLSQNHFTNSQSVYYISLYVFSSRNYSFRCVIDEHVCSGLIHLSPTNDFFYFRRAWFLVI